MVNRRHVEIVPWIGEKGSQRSDYFISIVSWTEYLDNISNYHYYGHLMVRSTVNVLLMSYLQSRRIVTMEIRLGIWDCTLRTLLIKYYPAYHLWLSTSGLGKEEKNTYTIWYKVGERTLYSTCFLTLIFFIRREIRIEFWRILWEV